MARSIGRQWCWVAALVLLPGCGSAEDGAQPLPRPSPVLWPSPVRFDPQGSFAAGHPAAVARISGWVNHVEGPVDGRPKVSHRGAFGTGNGRVFAQLGLADPLNTLHSLVGPTYDKQHRFFGDYAIRLVPASTGEAPDFDEEWAARSLSSPVLLTRGRLGDLQLDTLDFAPHAEDPLVAGCFVRVITVVNRGGQQSDPHELRVVATNATTEDAPGVMVERTDDRSLSSAFLYPAATMGDGELTIAVEPLAPGAEQQAVLVHCTGEGDGLVPIPAMDVAALLDDTAEQYQGWEQNLVQFDLPDPMVADFLDGMKLTLKTQTTTGGASCPMSEYTGIWSRDVIGPTLAWLDLGAHEDVRAMMDYLYAAVLHSGDLANSYEPDLALDELPAPPEWESMPTLSGRVAAETPSYLVWMYGAHYQHTGRLERAAERFGLLRRSLLAQGFSPEGLLPFTGDETYRAAMNVTFGLGPEHGHAEKSWSANSSVLWLGAAHHFRRLAEALGHDDAVAAATARYAEVEDALFEYLWLPDGCLSTHVDRASGQRWPAPFEDVALKVTWAGWRDADDPLARRFDTCHFDRLRTAPGQLQTMLPEDAATGLLGDMDAMYTGMLPGYALAALTAAGHIEAADAMNVLGASISSSGNLQEYNTIIEGERAGLSIVYDAGGFLGDYTAKYRPWEGGIDASAVFQYLLGFRPDVPARTLSLRPHLPEGWPSMTMRNLRAGDDRFDVEVVRAQQGHRVRIQSHAADAYDVVLRWDAVLGAPIKIAVDGVGIDEAKLERFEQVGLESVRTPLVPLPAGATIELTM